MHRNDCSSPRTLTALCFAILARSRLSDGQRNPYRTVVPDDDYCRRPVGMLDLEQTPVRSFTALAECLLTVAKDCQ
ncbi:hypothetical protein BDP55DRAFT_688422 [Colletotrichum godetiae]|uniref:Secreted protein n=1 Tax=Colletotrichum godetiae TaxID=1209918 RepID=A0AAJ0A516_9PEZI|nr:uncharacterized protein BDP55DRAFT_688422 [Colletotrichum godetiae]KAK1656631.1 hypothetical protein BDP55DRAFT_688422 [Colletotrichum godetiae]